MAAKIQKNDTVVVLTGKDKGKIGIVQKVIFNRKVLVSGVNIVTKHQKPVPSQNRSGGIVKKESYIHVSNVGVLNKNTGKSDKIGFRFDSGKKIRFFKSDKKKVT